MIRRTNPQHIVSNQQNHYSVWKSHKNIYHSQNVFRISPEKRRNKIWKSTKNPLSITNLQKFYIRNDLSCKNPHKKDFSSKKHNDKPNGHCLNFLYVKSLSSDQIVKWVIGPNFLLKITSGFFIIVFYWDFLVFSVLCGLIMR